MIHLLCKAIWQFLRKWNTDLPYLAYFWVVWLSSKESACNAGDPSSILGSRRFPWRRDRLSIPVFLVFPGGSVVKNPPAVQERQEMWVWSLGREDPLKKCMAAHSGILAWRIPWTEQSGRLQSIGSQRVRHDWRLGMHACILKRNESRDWNRYCSIIYSIQEVEITCVHQQMRYIHTMESYSALKRSGVLIHATTRMNLENIMLSKVNQKQKDKYHVIPLIWNVQNRQIYRQQVD